MEIARVKRTGTASSICHCESGVCSKQSHRCTRRLLPLRRFKCKGRSLATLALLPSAALRGSSTARASVTGGTRVAVTMGPNASAMRRGEAFARSGLVGERAGTSPSVPRADKELANASPLPCVLVMPRPGQTPSSISHCEPPRGRRSNLTDTRGDCARCVPRDVGKNRTADTPPRTRVPGPRDLCEGLGTRGVCDLLAVTTGPVNRLCSSPTFLARAVARSLDKR